MIEIAQRYYDLPSFNVCVYEFFIISWANPTTGFISKLLTSHNVPK